MFHFCLLFHHTLQKKNPVVLIGKKIILAPSNSCFIAECGKCMEGIPEARDVTVKNKQTLVYAQNWTLLSVCAYEQLLHFVLYCFYAYGNYWRDKLFFFFHWLSQEKIYMGNHCSFHTILRKSAEITNMILNYSFRRSYVLSFQWWEGK